MKFNQRKNRRYRKIKLLIFSEWEDREAARDRAIEIGNEKIKSARNLVRDLENEDDRARKIESLVETETDLAKETQKETEVENATEKMIKKNIPQEGKIFL